MNRRSFLKKVVGSMFGIAGISGGTYYYARNIEPELLTMQQLTITDSRIPSSFENFKIIQFSDTHIGFHYNLEQFEKLTAEINKLNPDLIVFTGDLVDDPDHYHWDSKLTTLLRNLHAPYGKYWVYGNHDHGGYGTETIKKVMEDAQFTLLQNSHHVIERQQDRILLAGIDDVILGRPDLTKTMANTNSSLFTLLLAHEPDFADTTIQYPIDVQLSGHSHGGQVRLPFIGHLYTPIYAEKYVQGTYTFPNNRLTLYVNKGIGTTRLPYRFFCKPEISIYTLKPE
ncbi:metallophosphoesterase [Ornithinibacillus contaminans]|uniref:metallophosphoesterase n=1 Tax=Ornithinibacillus contaminans TaxID=694055 RepID=UPI00064E114E|nr:metallophosphoesterase [Ornithinibacillus contaminans]